MYRLCKNLYSIFALTNHVVLLADTFDVTSGGASYRGCLGNQLQGSWFTRRSNKERDSGIRTEGIDQSPK